MHILKLKIEQIFKKIKEKKKNFSVFINRCHTFLFLCITKEYLTFEFQNPRKNKFHKSLEIYLNDKQTKSFSFIIVKYAKLFSVLGSIRYQFNKIMSTR